MRWVFLCLRGEQWHDRWPRQKTVIPVCLLLRQAAWVLLPYGTSWRTPASRLNRWGKGSGWNTWKKDEASCQRPICRQWQNCFFPDSVCPQKQGIRMLQHAAHGIGEVLHLIQMTWYALWNLLWNYLFAKMSSSSFPLPKHNENLLFDA